MVNQRGSAIGHVAPIDHAASIEKAALANPALRKAMAWLAFAPPPRSNTPAAFKELIAEETERWNGMLQTRHITPFH